MPTKKNVLKPSAKAAIAKRVAKAATLDKRDALIHRKVGGVPVNPKPAVVDQRFTSTAAIKKVSARMGRPRAFTSWGHSRLRDYDMCPAYAAYKHLDKLGEKENDAMIRGSDIAMRTEAYLRGEAAKLPKELNLMAADYKAIRKAPNLQVEQSWGFRRDWKPCDVKDWDNCWLRIKCDIVYEVPTEGLRHKKMRLQIDDNKTGRFDDRKNDEYIEQIKLYVTGGLIMHPEHNSVGSQLKYTDLGVNYPDKPAVFTQAELPQLIAYWNKRAAPMMADKRFTPRPGRYCGWCPHSKSKGGPCKF